MLLENILLAAVGLSSGMIVAAGTFAFIVMIGIITRLAQRTMTAGYTSLFENSIMLGGVIGNIWLIYGVHIPLGPLILLSYGLFSGIFVGCLAMALAEVLKVFPILVRRLGITVGIPIIVAAVAAGKLAGGLVQFVFLNNW